jgi:hypothetical protein
MRVMKNRYGDEYHWERINDNEYKFVMEGKSLDYCRWGGKEGQRGIDPNDLGMFDPSGGPYVDIGRLIEVGTVTHIRKTNEGFIVKVK